MFDNRGWPNSHKLPRRSGWQLSRHLWVAKVPSKRVGDHGWLEGDTSRVEDLVRLQNLIDRSISLSTVKTEDSAQPFLSSGRFH